MKKKTARKSVKPSSRGSASRQAARVSRARQIITRLKKLYPQADCALEHDSPLELLISTILSAQCTDERVNKVTPALFKKYRSAADFAKARLTDIEAMVRSTGFFHNKAKNIIGASQMIVERFAGKVPDAMEALLELPGVARKTANVLLGTWFGKNEGVVVDTHVGRLAHRLDLTWTSRDEKDAIRIENDLMQIVPRKDWTFISHALIWHGRKVCMARNPACERCTLAKLCPSAYTFGTPRPKN